MTHSPLDLVNGPIDRVRLVEASAGTGKTYAICLLYLRLVIEQDVPVEKILVVSFTQAATAELRERIRSRLQGTLERLRDPASATPEEAIDALLCRYASEGWATADLVARLDRAIAHFDQSAIYTIHGFCKRILDEAPFVTGMPLALELETDDSALRETVLRDLYRRWLARHPPAVAFAHRLWQESTLDALSRELRRRLGKPRAVLKWPPAGVPGAAVTDTDRAVYARAQAMWAAERDVLVARLKADLAETDSPLSGTYYNEKSIREGAEQWDELFMAATVEAAVLPSPVKDRRLDRYSSHRYVAKAKKRTLVPPPFFVCAAALLDRLDEIEAAVDAQWLDLVRTVVETGPEAVLAEKRRRRVLSFDDLLKFVHDRVTGEASASLCAHLQERYPVALVDEFQDTDPLQYGIFRAVYGERGTLVMVGDPKQAIYSFRNADLNVYLGASKTATAVHTLDQNQRSCEAYLDAVNALFGGNPQAFRLEGLQYHRLGYGLKSRTVFNDQGAERGALDVWLISGCGAEGVPTLAEARTAVAAATAAEIARLLRDAERGLVQHDGRALRAGEIAVIVPTKARGREVRRALARLNVGSVEISRESVYATDEAADLDRLLTAVLEPSRPGVVKTALATALVGFTADAIAALALDEQSLVDHVERFGGYRDLWQRRGVGVMLRRLFADYGVEARVLTGPLGERRLTNVRHLLERLHAAAEEHPTADALHRWLQSSRRERRDDDESLMRLESDQNLVQIVTIHVAKGLEYPVVFCPALWDSFLDGQDRGEAYEYHDGERGYVIDYSTDDAARSAAKAWARAEREAERVRLLYVALTRAVHRCTLVAGAFRKGKTPNAGARSALQWLVTTGTSPEAHAVIKQLPADTDAAWAALAGREPAVVVRALPTDAGVPLRPSSVAAASLVARRLRTPVPSGWRIGSYTGLVHGSVHEAAASDRDARPAVADGGDAIGAADPAAGVAADDILRFPRGAREGVCIHAVFEAADFTASDTWSAAVTAALRAHPPSPFTGDPTRPLLGLLQNVCSAPLLDGWTLASVPLSRRLTEWEFHLPVDRLDTARVSALLGRHGYAVPRLQSSTLSGYLHGFVDLVFEHGGRYYVLDWKSNHLGMTADGYGPDPLERAMTQNGYHLQHLLYTVAVHRFLAQRLTDYDYERHMGGALYLFVRGVRPAWPGAGVYHCRPERRLIEALSALCDRDGAP